MSARSRLRSIATGSATAVITVSLCFAVSPAQADPTTDQASTTARPTTVSQAKALVDKLNTESAAIDQEYAAAQDQAATSKKKLAQDQTDLAAQQKKVDAMRDQVASFALATYQRRGATSTAAFLGGSDANFFAKISTIQQVSSNQVTLLQKFQAEQGNLTSIKTAAEAEAATKAKAEADMADARTRSQAKLDEAQRVLDQLTAAERARLAAQEAREAAAARQAAARATTPAATTATTTERTTTRTSRSSSNKSSSQPVTNVPVSGRAAAAVAFAKAQVGKPYSYGSTGPGAFDCSGLTGAAWRAAGVGLPRTSQAQFGAGRSVSTSDLQPGDLVFYYSGISHVGIYIGGGMIVHAANPRTGVAYAGLHSMPLMGARRPG